MSEPYKFNLNPEATLRELDRQENDPGYLKTICGVHRKIWTLINVDLNGLIPQEQLDELNTSLETAYKMGKRMNYRLVEYFKAFNPGFNEESLGALALPLGEVFHSGEVDKKQEVEVQKPKPMTKKELRQRLLKGKDGK